MNGIISFWWCHLALLMHLSHFKAWWIIFSSLPHKICVRIFLWYTNLQQILRRACITCWHGLKTSGGEKNYGKILLNVPLVFNKWNIWVILYLMRVWKWNITKLNLWWNGQYVELQAMCRTPGYNWLQKNIHCGVLCLYGWR